MNVYRVIVRMCGYIIWQYSVLLYVIAKRYCSSSRQRLWI